MKSGKRTVAKQCMTCAKGPPYRSALDSWRSMRRKHENSGHFESQPRISPNGSVLYSTSCRPGTTGSVAEIRQAPIIPIVDFNADGIVDAADMYTMIDSWGTDDPLCDIGPMPWGDGIVDVQDSIVLAEYLPEEYPPIEPGE